MSRCILAKRELTRALFGGLALVGLAVSARAAPCVNTTPITPPAQAQGAGAGCGLVATDVEVQVVFAFTSATDMDTLRLPPFPGALINNKNTMLGHNTNLLGLSVGEALPFVLTDLTTNALHYTNAKPSTSPDGLPHTAYAEATTGTGPITSTSADLFYDGGSPRTPATLSPAVINIMNSIDSNSSDWLFIGFEDKIRRENSDFDYNDLIFAVNNVALVATPEPASLAVIGFGLVSLGLIRRRHIPKR